jgi:hypothetical protein
MTPDQALPQPRHGRDPRADQRANPSLIEIRCVVQQQDHSELFRHPARVHGQECPVGGTRPLNRRHRANPGATRGHISHASKPTPREPARTRGQRHQ